MNQGFPTIYIGSLRSETLEVQFLQQKIHFLVWDRSDPFWSIFWEVTPTPERDKNRGNHHEKHIDITHACWIYSPIDEWMHNLQFYPVFKNTKFMDVIPSNLLPVSVASANPYSWFNQPAIPVSLQWSLSLSWTWTCSSRIGISCASGHLLRIFSTAEDLILQVLVASPQAIGGITMLMPHCWCPSLAQLSRFSIFGCAEPKHR